MKPDSIRKFDMFYLGSVLLTIVSFIIGYDAFMAGISAQGAASGVALGAGAGISAFAIGIAISLLLWWLVSAKRLALAKWIIVALFVISLIGLPATLAGGLTMLDILGLATEAIQAVAIWFLFQPDAKAWFSGTEATGQQTDD